MTGVVRVREGRSLAIGVVKIKNGRVAGIVKVRESRTLAIGVVKVAEGRTLVMGV